MKQGSDTKVVIRVNEKPLDVAPSKGWKGKVNMKADNDLTPTYIRPYQIVKVYSIGRTTVWRLLNEMKKIPKYHKSILMPSRIVTLVNSRDFQEFMETRCCNYMRD